MSSVSRWEDPQNGCRTSCSALMDMSAHSTRRKIDKRCINLLLISAARIHLYLALLSHRDYFRRSNSSLSGFSVPQGLFRPTRCISISLFCSTGMLSTARMHLYLAPLSHRDYFAPAGCISIFLFCSTGIISTGQIHLYLAFLFHRDYFGRPDSSLPCSFAPQGLFLLDI